MKQNKDNKLFISITSKIVKTEYRTIEHYLFIVELNGKSKFKIDSNTLINKFYKTDKQRHFYRGVLLGVFLEDIYTFILEHFEHSKEIYNINDVQEVNFLLKKSKNYLESLPILIKKELSFKDKIKLEIKNDLDILTLENAIKNKSFFSEYFDFDYIEQKYPEYYI